MERDKLLTDEQFLPHAYECVASARERIYISTFKAELTTKPRGRKILKFFEQVFEKSRLGLDCRVLISRREGYRHIPVTNSYAIQKMKENKVKVRHLRNDRLCHAKILIVDKNVAIIGSHNLSVKSCHNNFEISYLTQNINLVEQLIEIYQTVWDTAKKG